MSGGISSMERHGSGLMGGRNCRHNVMRDMGLQLRKNRSKEAFRSCGARR